LFSIKKGVSTGLYLVIFSNITGEERGRVQLVDGKLVAVGNDPFVKGEVNYFTQAGLTPMQFFEKLSNRFEMRNSYVLHDDDDTPIVLLNGVKKVKNLETGRFEDKRPKMRNAIITCRDSETDNVKFTMKYEDGVLTGLDDPGADKVSRLMDDYGTSTIEEATLLYLEYVTTSSPSYSYFDIQFQD